MANRESTQPHGQSRRAELGDARETDLDAEPQVAVRLFPTPASVPATITIGEPTFIDILMVNEGFAGTVAVDMSADGRYKWGTGGFMGTGGWRTTTETIFRRSVSTITFRAGGLDFEGDSIVANPVHDKVQFDVESRSVGGLPLETVAAGASGFATGVFGTALATDQIQLPEFR